MARTLFINKFLRWTLPGTGSTKYLCVDSGRSNIILNYGFLEFIIICVSFENKFDKEDPLKLDTIKVKSGVRVTEGEFLIQVAFSSDVLRPFFSCMKLLDFS